MNSPDLTNDAHENLRVIRNLMERATEYRVISAVPALITGLLAIVGSLFSYFLAENTMSARGFVGLWIGIYLLVDLYNCGMLYRESRQRKAAFPSPQMIHAIMAMAPPLFALGVLGFIAGWFEGDLVRCALFWAVGYGLGLVAMTSFAPRSILNLGWGFLLSGLGWFILHFWLGGNPEGTAAIKRASLVMGALFGGLHLIYGSFTLLAARSSRA